MKAPRFWRNLNITACLLYPISVVYTIVSRLRYNLQTPVKFSKRIICVGNVTLGGSGKTPMCTAIGELLIKHGYRIAYACKSYKQKAELYDEGLLLSKIAPTFVDKDRIRAIAKAAREDIDFIIVDDGLQNNSFFKDIAVLVIDTNVGLGNNLIFPAGPLRESLDSGLKKADLVITIGNNLPHIGVKHIKASPIFQFNANKTNRYLAFAGIAYPIKFFSSLEEKGIKVIKKIEYPDHYNYTIKDIEDLIQQAKKLKAKLITTEKDLVKIPLKYKHKIECFRMKLKLRDEILLLKTTMATKS